LRVPGTEVVSVNNPEAVHITCAYCHETFFVSSELAIVFICHSVKFLHAQRSNGNFRTFDIVLCVSHYYGN